jgi:hypothetical protein
MRRTLAGIILIVLTSLSLVVAPVSAEDTTADTTTGGSSNVFSPDICSGKGADSAVCKDKDPSGNPLTGGDGAIMKIANIIAVVAGVGAVITIIVAGIRFIVGGGDSNAVAGARRAVIYALLGLVIIVTGRLIIGLIVGSL